MNMLMLYVVYSQAVELHIVSSLFAGSLIYGV